MQIENDYEKEVYNGDIGYVEDVDLEGGELSAGFDGRTVTYGFGELDALVPAYAATVHKSQGSEYPAVVIPVLTQHYAMLQRNLLYTGVTRGKRLVVLVGQKKAVAIAVRNVSGRRRWSKLDEWLGTETDEIASPRSKGGRMTKAELAARVADKVHLTNRQAEAVVNGLLRCIGEALREGDKVELRGFGSFRIRNRNARQGRNPRTGEAVLGPAKKVPFFRAG